MKNPARTPAVSLAIAPALALALLPGCADSAAPKSLTPLHAATPAANPRVLPADLDTLTGNPWTGTLTYLDYTSKKPTEIRSTLSFSRVTTSPAPAEPSWNMNVGYTDEPHANSGNVVVLRDQGRIFDDETITDRAELPNGAGVRFVAEQSGEDDKRPALIRHVYTITPREFTLQKLVRFPEEAEFFERHVYRWTR